jgi:hypothetical protein
MESLRQESVRPDPFAFELGLLLSGMAKRHLDPDNGLAWSFIGTSTDGKPGVISLSPREYAEEVVNGTDYGLQIVEFFRTISNGLGDPTGRQVLADLSGFETIPHIP